MSESWALGVVGAGAWGTALALVALQTNENTILWSHEEDVAESINNSHENQAYLPQVALPPGLKATANLADLAHCDALLMVTPAQFLRATLSKITAAMAPKPLVLCAKGIEQGTLKFMSEVAAEVAAEWPLAVLSGPSFAADVARGLPTAVTLAAEDEALAKSLAAAIGGPYFRPYLSTDVIGAEIGGAVKNVLAIACGIVEGRGLGRSAHAALIARGFAEMNRLGLALGASLTTMSGLAGLGDLVLTCSSTQSRNMSLGHALGEGKPLADILAARTAVTEGVATAPALVMLAKSRGIEMPISEAVNDILSGAKSVDAAIETLLSRPFSFEGH